MLGSGNGDGGGYLVSLRLGKNIFAVYFNVTHDRLMRWREGGKEREWVKITETSNTNFPPSSWVSLNALLSPFLPHPLSLFLSNPSSKRPRAIAL